MSPERVSLELSGPPPRILLPGELRFLLDFARLLSQASRLRRLPRGGGEPVLLLPGLGAGHGWMSWLRRYLARQGYDARHWGLGRNRGDVRRLVPEVVDRVAELSEGAERRVRLVGWSLGGVIAREVARERPDLVRGVLTMGSPVVGGARYTLFARRFERQGHDLEELERAVAKRNQIPFEVPVSALYSRRDAIVAWQACIDPVHRDIRHTEVRTAHLGFPVCPEVYRLVAIWLREMAR